MKGRPEPWAWAAFLLGAAVAAGWGYLLSRPGGAGPVWFYGEGRYYAVLAALALAALGLVCGLRARPFLGRSRGVAFAVLLLVVGAAPFPVPYPSSREFQPSASLFRLPVEGTWRVVYGGDGGAGPLAHLPDRRFGLVLVREVEGRRWPAAAEAASAELRPQDCYAFGQAVVSPVAGRVAAAVDGFADRGPGRTPEGPPAGNHVVLELTHGEFLVLAHLRQGSVQAQVGQVVEPGTHLGEVGASGSGALLGEPHVSVHIQTSVEAFAGEAVPWKIAGYSIDGMAVPSGLPRGGVALDGTLEGQSITHGVPQK